MKNKQKFECQKCKVKFSKWQGQCTSCYAWNSIDVYCPQFLNVSNSNQELFTINNQKHQTCFEELNKVFDGGLPDKAFILIGGEPGVGKSSYISQLIHSLSIEDSIIYFSGEETIRQIETRFKRLNAQNPKVMVSDLKELDKIKSKVIENKSKVIVIDSIQTLVSSSLYNTEVSVNGLKSIVHELMDFINTNNIICLSICHITKQGKFSGPKTIEHMVDASLLMENTGNEIILNIKKNRFGESQKSITLEMTNKGLSESSLKDINLNLNQIQSGAVWGVDIVNDKYFLRETQSLVFLNKKIKKEIFSYQVSKIRINMLVATLEKTLGLGLSECDIYNDFISTKRIYSKQIELGIVASILSSFYEINLPKSWVFVGEIDLLGRVRLDNKVDTTLNPLLRINGITLITSFEFNSDDDKMIRIRDCKELKNLIVGYGNEQKVS